MTEAIGERIRPPKAAYKETPYESPARLGNGGAPSLHETAMTLAHAPSPAAHLIKGIEEASPDPSTALIDAVRKVYAAVTQKPPIMRAKRGSCGSRSRHSPRSLHSGNLTQRHR